MHCQLSLLLSQVTQEDLRSRMVAEGLLRATYKPGELVLIPSSTAGVEKHKPHVKSNVQRQHGPPGKKQPQAPNPSAARPVDTSQRAPNGHHNTRADSSTNSVQEQPRHSIHGCGDEGPRVAASPARRSRAAGKVWECGQCGMTERSKLRECSGCKSVRYCGKVCQKAAWPEHKATCKRLQAALT
jgi:hypothetical protein